MSRVAAGAEDDSPGKIRIELPITVKKLGMRLNRKPYVLIDALMNHDRFYSMNMQISKEDIKFLGREYCIEVEIIE